MDTAPTFALKPLDRVKRLSRPGSQKEDVISTKAMSVLSKA